MASSKSKHVPLSQEHAFVVQLHEKAGRVTRKLTGRVEHIPTGKNATFASLEELSEFIGGKPDARSKKK